MNIEEYDEKANQIISSVLIHLDRGYDFDIPLDDILNGDVDQQIYEVIFTISPQKVYRFCLLTSSDNLETLLDTDSFEITSPIIEFDIDNVIKLDEEYYYVFELPIYPQPLKELYIYERLMGGFDFNPLVGTLLI